MCQLVYFLNPGIMQVNGLIESVLNPTIVSLIDFNYLVVVWNRWNKSIGLFQFDCVFPVVLYNIVGAYSEKVNVIF